MLYSCLDSCARIGEIRKKIELFNKVMKGLKEDFLQRLTSAVNRMISNSEVRQIMESLTFVNVNSLDKSKM